MTKLSLVNLPIIAKKINVPKYARADLRPGILHFGVGNFHRAHIAVYLDDLFNLGVDHDWSLIGTGVVASDETGGATMDAQICLTPCGERDNEIDSAHFTGAWLEFIISQV